MDKDKRFAVLIDADNISPKYIDIILTETANYGTASIRRIYGDWTDNSKHSWKECLLQNSLTPIQQYSYTVGKNSSDSAMIIDAMDILYGNHVDGFVIATSDSDFTTLARRLREDGKMVIGMGESKTPMPFIKACEQFKTLDVLYEGNGEEAEKADAQKGDKTEQVVPITSLKTIRKTIMSIIDEQTEDGEWMNLGELGNILQKRYPDFDCRVYHFSKFSSMVSSFPDVELRREGDNRVWVRKKAEDPKKTEDTGKADESKKSEESKKTKQPARRRRSKTS